NTDYVERARVQLQVAATGGYLGKRLEHDAYHVGLARFFYRRRPGFAGMGACFLTRHGLLTIANEAFPEVDVPLVLTLDAWVLWFRPLLPRTEDFASFFAAMVSRHLFSGFYVDVQSTPLMKALSAGESGRTGVDAIETAFRYANSKDLARLSSDPSLDDDTF